MSVLGSLSPHRSTQPPSTDVGRAGRRVTFAAHHLLLLGETVQGSHLADEGLGDEPVISQLTKQGDWEMVKVGNTVD